MELRTCNNCKKVENIDREQGNSGTFPYCGKCRAANYCCVECQKADWPSHKLICTEISKLSDDPKITKTKIDDIVHSIVDDENKKSILHSYAEVNYRKSGVGAVHFSISMKELDNFDIVTKRRYIPQNRYQSEKMSTLFKNYNHKEGFILCLEISLQAPNVIQKSAYIKVAPVAEKPNPRWNINTLEDKEGETVLEKRKRGIKMAIKGLRQNGMSDKEIDLQTNSLFVNYLETGEPIEYITKCPNGINYFCILNDD